MSQIDDDKAHWREAQREVETHKRNLEVFKQVPDQVLEGVPPESRTRAFFQILAAKAKELVHWRVEVWKWEQRVYEDEHPDEHGDVRHIGTL